MPAPAMPQSIEHYRDRTTQFIGLWMPGVWRIKLYGIHYHQSSAPGETLISAGKQSFEGSLKKAESNGDAHGLGFGIIHAGRECDFVALYWWGGENMLFCDAHASSAPGKTDFSNISATGNLGCVWDLQVITHERHAWVKHVLSRPGKPDITGYLDDVLHFTV